jgi:hypothetical protein
MTLTMKRVSLVATAAALSVLAVLLGVVLTNRGSSANILTADEVQRQLAGADPSSSVAFPGVDPSSTASAGNLRRTVLNGKSVSVVAFCDGATPGAATWSPMPGYRIDDATRGSGSTVVTLWVESDVANDVTATITCDGDGTAAILEQDQADDHGGGDNHGGSGNGGPGSGGSGTDDPANHQ